MIRYFAPILVLALAIGCAGPAHQTKGPGGPGDQPAPPPAANPGQRLDNTMRELTQQLKLRPDQAERVRAILKQDEEKREQIPPGSQTADPRREMAKVFAQMQQIDQETQQALSQVLNPAQMADYQKYQDEQRKRLYRGRPDSFGKRKDKDRNRPVPDGQLPRSLDPSRR